jgi:GNAT superfamily N-acetyltransferase
VEVVTHYLEMTSPDDLRPSGGVPDRLDFGPVREPSPEFAWFLYVAVGRDWHWVDRLGWDRDRWRDHVARDDVALHLALLDGAPAGYVEYRTGLPSEVQIWYFGLLPGYTGRGLGGELLTRAVRSAWAWEPQRVWLHTCSLDAPVALDNYLARGFRKYDETREMKVVKPYPDVRWPT